MPKKGQSSVPLLKRRLGRGLGSLISQPVEIEVEAKTSPPHSPPASPLEADESLLVHLIKLEQIHPNPRQPRQDFSEESMRQLAESLKRDGLMQPIVVRPAAVTGKKSKKGAVPTYEIVAGERRWRAAREAGLKKIPAVIRELDDATAAQLALVENLQREDLNPMERAEAFSHLIEEHALTHQDIADRIGLNRSSITNHLRLLELDEETSREIRAGALSIGHGKALLTLTNPEDRQALAKDAVRHCWSVRALERKVKRQIALQESGGGDKGAAARNASLETLQKRLGEHLGTRVQVKPGRAAGSGRLVIEFYDLDQFDGLLKRMDFKTDF